MCSSPNARKGCRTSHPLHFSVIYTQPEKGHSPRSECIIIHITHFFTQVRFMVIGFLLSPTRRSSIFIRPAPPSGAFCTTPISQSTRSHGAGNLHYISALRRISKVSWLCSHVVICSLLESLLSVVNPVSVSQRATSALPAAAMRPCGSWLFACGWLPNSVPMTPSQAPK